MKKTIGILTISISVATASVAQDTPWHGGFIFDVEAGDKATLFFSSVNDTRAMEFNICSVTPSGNLTIILDGAPQPYLKEDTCRSVSAFKSIEVDNSHISAGGSSMPVRGLFSYIGVAQ